MTRQVTQIISNPELIPYPFTFKRYIEGQGYEVTVTFPDFRDDPAMLIAQAKTQNPKQLSAAKLAGAP